MNRLKSAGLALAAGFAAFAVASCATPTPYGPAQESAYGFREQRIENNRFTVSFAGNSATAPEAVGDAALRRAADLTLQEGYEWFEVVSRTDNQDGDRGGGTGMSVGVGGSSGSYGSSTGVGVGLSFPLGGGGGGATTTTLEILMGRGERPDRPSVYDAMSVSNNLARAAAAEVDQGY